MNAALSRAKTALEGGIGVPVYLGMFLNVNEDGLLVLPDDESQIVLHAITGDATHEWANYSFDTVRVQVNAFSRVEGTQNALLVAARPLLTAAKFIPRMTRSLARDGPYLGAAQDWEVNT